MLIQSYQNDFWYNFFFILKSYIINIQSIKYGIMIIPKEGFKNKLSF